MDTVSDISKDVLCDGTTISEVNVKT